MNILITGATGFVGKALVAALAGRGHALVAVARRFPEPIADPHVRTVPFDVQESAEDPAAVLGVPDALIHLAWPGLPNFTDPFHYEVNLPAQYRFLRRMIEAGTRQVLVAGTCLEYGMRCGALDEALPAMPSNPYAIAKNSLRQFLDSLRQRTPFVLKWVRLFYLHGPGQASNSLLAQLDRALATNATEFDMSTGEQIRDYLPIQIAANHIAKLVEHPTFDGIVNCCSGEPISVRRLVEGHLQRRGARLTLNLGRLPYPAYEPFAFWGDTTRLRTLIGTGA
jgi:dTDP-6-deoxy-L-talose 4-dehydrogenase (NAD+)